MKKKGKKRGGRNYREQGKCGKKREGKITK